MADNTIPNRTIFIRDNLEVMRGMSSESVDLIYLDPPFNKGQQWSAPVGSQAAGAAFKDAWTLDDVKEEWVGEIEEANPALHHTIVAAGFTHGESMQGYLTYMAIRLLEMRRILKETGSIYLHCDSTASHYLKALMDAVFGNEHFRTDIIWQRTSAHPSARRWASTYDNLVFYTKSEKYTWNPAYYAPDENYVRTHYIYEDSTGRYRAADLTGAGISSGQSGQIWRGFNPSEKGRHWAYIPDTLDRMDAEGLIHWPAKQGGWPSKKVYWDETKRGRPVHAVWIDVPPVNSQAKERLGYPTQKPLALLERVVKASSNEDNVVLDPFCGCATTCVAAEKLGRQWIGIDLSEKAYDLVVQRLAREVKVGSAEAPTLTGWNVVKRTDIPVRTDAAGRRRSKNIRETLYGRQGGYCNGCGVHFPPRNLTLDHVVPRAKGGADADENLQLLCGACNSMKGSTRTQDELKAELRKRGLLH